MNDALHALLEQWEDYARDRLDAGIDDFIQSIEGNVDREVVDQFRDAAQKLNRIDRRLKQIGVESRDSA